MVGQRNLKYNFVESLHEVTVKQLHVPECLADKLTSKSEHLNVVGLHGRLRVRVVCASRSSLSKQGHISVEKLLTYLRNPFFKQTAFIDSVLALKFNLHPSAPLLRLKCFHHPIWILETVISSHCKIESFVLVFTLHALKLSFPDGPLRVEI